MAGINPFMLFGLGFSALAGLAAFLITYEEWSHHYPSKREPLKYATEAAVVAFVVFVVLTMLVITYVSRFMSD